MDIATRRADSGLLHTAPGWLARHRKGVVALAVMLLAGFGITAVAVAPLAPDAAALPQRVVQETLQPQGLEQQLSALADHGFTLVRSEITRGTDSAEALFGRLGIQDSYAAAFIRSDATARKLVTGRGGKLVQAETDADGLLTRLVARWPAEEAQSRTHFTRMTVERVGARWLARLETAPYTAAPRLASGTIRSSLFAATDEAGLPDSIAAQLADIFATDIDFHRELKRGDTFHVVYETLFADGQPVPWNEGAGRVLAAEFVNGGRAHHALWFAGGAQGKGGWYDIDGKSKRRAFLASPMEFSRVTSGFAMRLHPILKTWRKHNGVDYAAPKGTPVRSVGDGVVTFSGWQNGYGNVVEIDHGNGRETLYAHLSRIDVRKGQRIEQGTLVGAVGATGWATGPHLHFEFQVRGVHQDPLRIAKAAEAAPVDPRARAQFGEAVRTLQAKLDLAESLGSRRGASVE